MIRFRSFLEKTTFAFICGSRFQVVIFNLAPRGRETLGTSYNIFGPREIPVAFHLSWQALGGALARETKGFRDIRFLN